MQNTPLKVHRLSDDVSYLIGRFDQMRIGKVSVAHRGREMSLLMSLAVGSAKTRSPNGSASICKLRYERIVPGDEETFVTRQTRLGRGLCQVRQGFNPFSIVNSHFRQHLPVQGDVGFGQLMDKTAVG